MTHAINGSNGNDTIHCEAGNHGRIGEDGSDLNRRPHHRERADPAGLCAPCCSARSRPIMKFT